MNLIQVLFAIALVMTLILLFFIPVPEANAEYVKTVLTALISFLSGAATAYWTNKKGGLTNVTKTVTDSDSASGD